MVICLEQGADLHTAQLMPLLLTVSCFSKIQIGLTFLVPAHLCIPGNRAVKRVWVTVMCWWMWTAADWSEHIVRDRRADVRGFCGAVQVQLHGDRSTVWHRSVCAACDRLRARRIQTQVAWKQSGDETHAESDGRAGDPRCQGVQRRYIYWLIALLLYVFTLLFFYPYHLLFTVILSRLTSCGLSAPWLKSYLISFDSVEHFVWHFHHFVLVILFCLT